MYFVVFFIIGLFIGKFSNICADRWIPEESIWTKPKCSFCQKEIPWCDNLPVIGFLYSKGKCRYCHSPISLRYPIVELIMGIGCCHIFNLYGLSYTTVLLIFTSWIMMVAMITDVLDRIIPNELILVGVGAVIINGFFSPSTVSDIAIGFFGPALFLIITSMVVEILANTDCAIGGGDIKLMVVLGGLWGWQMPVIILVGGCYILATVYLAYAVIDMTQNKQTYVPMMVGFGIMFLYMLLNFPFDNGMFNFITMMF